MYSPYHHILIVGETNFTFSAALAQQLQPIEGTLIACTPLSKAQTFRTYDGVEHALHQLSRAKGRFPGGPLYRFDHYRMSHFLNGRHWLHKFDRIILNYPYHGNDVSVETEQRMLLHFLAGASSFLDPHGEIHIRLCNHQEERWEIKNLLKKTNLRVLHVTPFDEFEEFPDYVRTSKLCDRPWLIEPGTACTVTIGARGSELCEEDTTRRLLFSNFKKRKRVEEKEEKREQKSSKRSKSKLFGDIHHHVFLHVGNSDSSSSSSSSSSSIEALNPRECPFLSRLCSSTSSE